MSLQLKRQMQVLHSEWLQCSSNLPGHSWGQYLATWSQLHTMYSAHLHSAQHTGHSAQCTECTHYSVERAVQSQHFTTATVKSPTLEAWSRLNLNIVSYIVALSTHMTSDWSIIHQQQCLLSWCHNVNKKTFADTKKKNMKIISYILAPKKGGRVWPKCSTFSLSFLHQFIPLLFAFIKSSQHLVNLDSERKEKRPHRDKIKKRQKKDKEQNTKKWRRKKYREQMPTKHELHSPNSTRYLWLRFGSFRPKNKAGKSKGRNWVLGQKWWELRTGSSISNSYMERELLFNKDKDGYQRVLLEKGHITQPLKAFSSLHE